VEEGDFPVILLEALGKFIKKGLSDLSLDLLLRSIVMLWRSFDLLAISVGTYIRRVY